MRGTWRSIVVIVLALLVPIVPFVLFGDRLDAWVADWLDPPPPPATIALATIGVLAVDVLLPVPSSVVSTLAGSRLGVVPATAVSWLGMTMGAMFAFWLARTCGRPLAVRLSSADDLDQMDRLAERVGRWVLIVTRPLPILAEAAVLLVGTTDMSWRRFLPPVLWSNLGIALVWAAFGQMASSFGELPLALGASIALPLVATAVARWLVGRSGVKSHDPDMGN
ncbi:MAG: TVP38/TMEM64 family protein [Pirellulales bacterium]